MVQNAYKNHRWLLKPGVYYRNGFYYVRIFNKIELKDWKQPKTFWALLKRWHDRLTTVHINYSTAGQYDALYFCRVTNDRDGSFIAFKHNDDAILRKYIRPILTEEYYSNRHALSKIFNLPKLRQITQQEMQEQFISGPPLSYSILLSCPAILDDIFQCFNQNDSNDISMSPSVVSMTCDAIYNHIISINVVSHGDLRCHNIVQAFDGYYVIDLDPTTLKKRFILFDLLTLITDGGNSIYWISNSLFDEFICKFLATNIKISSPLSGKFKTALHEYYLQELRRK